MLRLAYAAYLESKAEAVVCISNSSVTWQVVHGLERRGIPAFGPIWDSWGPVRLLRKSGGMSSDDGPVAATTAPQLPSKVLPAGQ